MPVVEKNLIDRVRDLEEEVKELKLLMEDIADAWTNINNSHKDMKWLQD